MATEHAVGHVSQIPPGEGRTFDLDGKLIAVFRTRGGGVFATQAYCPHRGGPLADGLTDEKSVVCPLHDRIYDMGTGIGTDCNIETYPVRVSIDGIILLVPHSKKAMA
jgi:nitrite reductase (NADH) small subunit